MSMPCDTGVCTPENCTDTACPSYGPEKEPVISPAEQAAIKRGANQFVSEHRSFITSYINKRHPHNKGAKV